MSTNYFIGCRKCRVYMDLAVRFGGVQWRTQTDAREREQLGRFLEEHTCRELDVPNIHDPFFFDEHNDWRLDDGVRDITAEKDGEVFELSDPPDGRPTVKVSVRSQDEQDARVAGMVCARCGEAGRGRTLILERDGWVCSGGCNVSPRH